MNTDQTIKEAQTELLNDESLPFEEKLHSAFFGFHSWELVVKLLRARMSKGSREYMEFWHSEAALNPATAHNVLHKTVILALSDEDGWDIIDLMSGGAAEPLALDFFGCHKASPCRGCAHSPGGCFGCYSEAQKPQGDAALYPTDSLFGRAQYYHAHPCPFREPREQ